jgi:hypothetical protein
MSLDPLGAEHNAKWKVHVFENRSLLDVQFQISGYIATFNASITDSINVDATVAKGILQTNSIAVYTDTVNGDGMSTGKRRRSEETPAEARAFLIGPIDQPNREGRPAVIILGETAKHLKAGKYPQAAIQPAAVRYRIKMTSQNKRAFRITSQSGPGVPRGVVVVFYRQAVQLALKPFARRKPDRTPRKALGPKIIGRQGAELFEIRNYPK